MVEPRDRGPRRVPAAPAPRRLLRWSLFGLAAAACGWTHYAAAVGAHDPNIFDGALFLLQSIYTAQGLVPYRDFGFVYSPGFAILAGDLLGLARPGQVTAAAWLMVIAVLLANLALLARLAVPGRRLWAITGFLALSALVALFWGEMGSEPFSPGLLALCGLGVLHLMRRGAGAPEIAVVFAAAAAITLVRWDRAVPVVLLLACAAAALWAAARLLPRLRPGLAAGTRRLAAAAAAFAAGTLAGLAAAMAYAAARGALPQAIDWLFVVPFATLPYRVLPLPGIWPLQRDEAQWLLAPLALAVLLAGWLAAYRPWRAPGMVRLPELAALLVPPVAVVPYAFGRADAPHFLTLTVAIGVVVVLVQALWPRPAATAAALLAAALLLLPVAQHAERLLRKLGPLPDAGHAMRTALGWAADCTPLIPAQSRSLFVGQQRYDRFIVNWPVFHLARPDLRPATAYVIEEPGQQNTCRRGAAVARDLAAAPRPMAALLDTEAMDPEPNATRTMTSCGRIEAALAALPHREIALCRFAGRTLRLRLYD